MRKNIHHKQQQPSPATANAGSKTSILQSGGGGVSLTQADKYSRHRAIPPPEHSQHRNRDVLKGGDTHTHTHTHTHCIFDTLYYVYVCMYSFLVAYILQELCPEVWLAIHITLHFADADSNSAAIETVTPWSLRKPSTKFNTKYSTDTSPPRQQRQQRQQPPHEMASSSPAVRGRGRGRGRGGEPVRICREDFEPTSTHKRGMYVCMHIIGERRH